MVDVGAKPVTDREAVARGRIAMSAAARRQIRSGAVKKGDPLQAARLAGIMAAKKTSELIPLCHPLVLTHVSVELTPTGKGYDIEARVRTSGQTGVEMEALTAVSVAALTLYDMVKAVDKAAVITDIAPMVNIPSFGMCQSLANPTVAAATAAALGTLTPMPCVPATAAPWAPPAAQTVVGGIPGFTASARTVCMFGGSIGIVMAGSMKTTIG